MKKMEDMGKVNGNIKSKADPAHMIIAGMAVQAEPFSLAELLINTKNGQNARD